MMAAPLHAVTYNINLAISDARVTGFIATDGSLGTINAANITDFSLTVTTPFASDTILPTPGLRATGGVFSLGDGLTATPGRLIYDTSFNGAFGLVNFLPDARTLFFINSSDARITGLAGVQAYAAVDTQAALAAWTDNTILVRGAYNIGFAQIPLPASALLLLSALGVFAALRQARIGRVGY